MHLMLYIDSLFNFIHHVNVYILTFLITIFMFILVGIVRSPVPWKWVDSVDDHILNLNGPTNGKLISHVSSDADRLRRSLAIDSNLVGPVGLQGVNGGWHDIFIEEL